jgi:hypothetical protein
MMVLCLNDDFNVTKSKKALNEPPLLLLYSAKQWWKKQDWWVVERKTKKMAGNKTYCANDDELPCWAAMPHSRCGPALLRQYKAPAAANKTGPEAALSETREGTVSERRHGRRRRTCAVQGRRGHGCHGRHPSHDQNSPDKVFHWTTLVQQRYGQLPFCECL